MNTEEQPSQEKKKRINRFSLIISVGVFCAFILVFMAVFFWPTIIDLLKSSNGKKYSIQIRAFPETKINDATEFITDLRKIHPDVHMDKVYIRGQGVWNRILIGHFTTFEEASIYMKEKKLFDAYPGSFVKLISEG
jgi:hypothetical protein